MKNCKHDFEHPIRLRRAHYICPKCKDNITMALVFLEELKHSAKYEKESSHLHCWEENRYSCGHKIKHLACCICGEKNLEKESPN